MCLDRHLGPHILFLTFSLFKYDSLKVVPRVNGADYVQGVPSHMLSHSILYAALCHMPCICHVFFCVAHIYSLLECKPHGSREHVYLVN